MEQLWNSQGGRHYTNSILTFSVHVLNENTNYSKVHSKLVKSVRLENCLVGPTQIRIF